MTRRLVLALGISLPLGLAGAADRACQPEPLRQAMEIFMSADCARCWEQADEAAAPGTLRLDWIVPGLQGDEAPLAVAALPEAGARLKQPLGPERGSVQRQRLPASPGGVRLAVHSGLAWNGYIGLSFELERGKALPADAQGWVALVERVPAGEDNTPIARQLVRTLVGPLPLQAAARERRVQHLRAVLLPPNSRAERLAAAGWVERADGRILIAAQSPAAGCTAP
ncbi:MAG: hypothetical protein AB1430_18355 [Pseudomonadota bacterium]